MNCFDITGEDHAYCIMPNSISTPVTPADNGDHGNKSIMLSILCGSIWLMF